MPDPALMKGVVRHLRRTERRRLYDVLADRELLARFLRERDEAAFEELVGRHGPMVRAVCRRVLGPTADADDAFQAAFLVLLRKARSIRQKDLIANWLCAVAFRTARQALRRRSRLGARERTGAELPESSRPDAPPRDWMPLFDAALQRLPTKYREPVVLCELQGLSRPEAARHLGLNEGTLSSRLGRARDLLRRRLSPYGFPLSVGAALAPAVVPEALTASTAAAAVSVGAASVSAIVLTEGVLTAMFASKLKAGAACTAVLLAGAVAGFQFVGPAQVAGGPPAKDGPPAKEAAKSVAVGDSKPAPVSAELEPFQGTWRVTSAQMNGRIMPPSGVGIDESWTFDGGTLRTGVEAKDDPGAPIRVDVRAKPAAIDFTLAQFHSNGTGALVSEHFQGIYRFEPDGQLLICFRVKGEGRLRPTKFGTAPQSGAILLGLERLEPPAPVAANPGGRRSVWVTPPTSLTSGVEDGKRNVERTDSYPATVAYDKSGPAAADADLARVVGAWELTDVDGQTPDAAAAKLDAKADPGSGRLRSRQRWEGLRRLQLLPAAGPMDVTNQVGALSFVAYVELDGTRTPKWFTLHATGMERSTLQDGTIAYGKSLFRLCGIYALNGEKLVICLPEAEGSPLLRPTDFRGDGEGGVYLLTFQRAAKNWKPDAPVAAKPVAGPAAGELRAPIVQDPLPPPVNFAPAGTPPVTFPTAPGNPVVFPGSDLPGPVVGGPLPSPAPADPPFVASDAPLSAPAYTAEPPAAAPRSDLDRVQGTWVMIQVDGSPAADREKQASALEFLQDRVLTTDGTHGRIRLDESKSPKQVTITLGKRGEAPVTGIYRLDGDRLVIAASTKSPKLVPTDFEHDPEAGVSVTVYERPRAPVAAPPAPRADPSPRPPARDLQKEIDQLREHLRRLERELKDRDRVEERVPTTVRD